MAPTGWRSPHSVIRQLLKEAHRFDFHQAVSLIERLHPEASSVGVEPDPEAEAVRFRSSLARSFPASDLDVVTLKRRRPGKGPGKGDRRWEVVVNFMGLAGGFGPLPPPFTDAILQQWRDGDTATRDFLDIFNHRLVSLLYQTRRRHRPALNSGGPDEGPFAGYLYSLIGMGTGALRGRMTVPDRVLLHHAGVLAQQPRSLHGLERILTCHFDVPVRAHPLQGRWLKLDATQTTRLGQRNSVLGDSAALGTRVWDQQAAVVLELGPLDLESFRGFLPNGHAALPLRDLTRFYVGSGTDTDLRLRLKPDQVPATRLPKRGPTPAETPAVPPRLGWTSWLKTRPRTDEGVVTVCGSAGTHTHA